MLAIKTILSKIYIDKSCYIFIIFALLSARFQYVILISILLLVHECGHFFTALFFKWPTERIVFYPFGGVAKFSHDINCSLKEEILVLLMGPIMQLVCYYILISIDMFNNYYQNIMIINYSILIFNLLPIYPLDGGRLLHCFICYFISYDLSFKIIYFISYSLLLIIIFVFIYNPSINLILIVIILIIKLLKEQRLINYYKEKFLLERYLYKYNFKKSKIVTKENNFKRDYHHLVKIDRKYFLEEEYLKNKYKNNRL